jgi:hypothetical protein
MRCAEHDVLHLVITGSVNTRELSVQTFAVFREVVVSWRDASCLCGDGGDFK